MVFGIVAFLVFGLLIWVGARYCYWSGYTTGVLAETQGWVDAVSKVTAPNWQSVPTPPDLTPEKAKEAKKLYVDIYAITLDIIVNEIIENRRAALRKKACFKPYEF